MEKNRKKPASEEKVEPLPQKIPDETVVVAVKDQISCELADGSVVLSLSDGIYYGFNSVASRIWKLVEEPKTFREIQEILLTEYEVDVARCVSEIQVFLHEMVAKNLIEMKDGASQ